MREQHLKKHKLLKMLLQGVAMVRGKSLENEEYSRSGYFSFGQGILVKMINVREFKDFPHKK